MAQPPLSAIFSDIRSEEDIDQFYHQQDLKKLRELIDLHALSLAAGKENDKIYMISLLWREKKEIPSHLNLTWGEPYDSLLQQYPQHLSILFEKQNALSGFLMGYQKLKKYVLFRKYRKHGAVSLVYGFLRGYKKRIIPEINARLFLNPLPIKPTQPVIINDPKEIMRLREMCQSYNEDGGEFPISLDDIQDNPLAMVASLLLRKQGENHSFLGEAVGGFFHLFVETNEDDNSPVPYQNSAIYLTLTKVKQLREFLLGAIIWKYYMFDDIGMEHEHQAIAARRMGFRDELIKHGLISSPSASCEIPDWRQSDKFLLERLNALPTIRLIDLLYEAENWFVSDESVSIWDYLDYLNDE